MSKYKGIRFLNEDTDNAVIEIYGAIGVEAWDKEYDENTARQMSEELQRLKALDAKSITVKINSLGGDVNHALAIHDLLAEHPAEISTQINGLCASAATIIAMAGTTRRMSKNALMLIHQCSAYVGRANATQLEQELEAQRTVNERLLSIYAERCPDKAEKLQQLLRANNGTGRWLDATEAKDLGLATDIYNDSRKAASFPAQMLARLPQLPDGYADEAEEPQAGTLQEILHALRNILPTKNQNQTAMKNTFPLIALALALPDAATYSAEQGLTMDDSQLQTMEQRLKELSDLKASLEALKADKKTADENISTLTAERDRLKAIVDALPGSTPQVSGDDHAAPQDNIADYVSKSPIYAQIRTEI